MNVNSLKLNVEVHHQVAYQQNVEGFEKNLIFLFILTCSVFHTYMSQLQASPTYECELFYILCG